MKKSTISIIILFSLLTIASVSAFWTFFLKNKIAEIQQNHSTDSQANTSTPDNDKILEWIFDHQMDSLELAAKNLKKHNPHLSRKITRYLKSHKVTNTGLFTKIEDIAIKEMSSPQAIDKKEPSSENDIPNELQISESDNQQHEVQSESNNNKEINIKYLRFKIGKNNVYYTGDIVNGKADGIGKGVFDNGLVYEGQWDNNSKQGKGKEFFPDGSFYEGSFSNNMRSGIGTYVSKYNEKYVGQWENDMQQGQGTLYDKKGKVKYKGEWKANVFIN
ncbi:MAG: hypothetical protein M9958_08000 [Chitinophagales bacterium]|nr:hypothetical protein [Chitinophagales bacterium]